MLSRLLTLFDRARTTIAIEPEKTWDYEMCLCGKRMIPISTGFWLGYRYWHWWCACGNTKPGGRQVDTVLEDARRARWEIANDRIFDRSKRAQ